MEILGYELTLPPYLDHPMGEFLVSIGIWTLVSILVFIIVDVFLHILVKKTETDVDDKICHIVRLPIILLVLLYGIVTSISHLGLSPSVEDKFMLVYRVALTLALFSVGWKIYDNVLLPLIGTGTERSDPTLAKTLIPTLEIIGKVVLLFVGIIVFLSFLGVNVTLLVASFGIAGLVIAFAAQDSLSNLFAGLMLLSDRPFKLGDVIQLEDENYYEVKRVGMRSTRLYDIFMNNMSVVPNSVIAKQRIINISIPDPMIKTRVKVDIAYSADVDKAMQIMLDMASETESVIVEDEAKKPFVRLIDFKDSGVALMMIFWVNHYFDQWLAASNIRKRTLEEFRKQGVEIPFPQVVVHMDEK